MSRIVSYDHEGNMYLETVPGCKMEDKDLTDEEICKKYDLVKPENTGRYFDENGEPILENIYKQLDKEAELILENALD